MHRRGLIACEFIRLMTRTVFFVLFCSYRNPNDYTTSTAGGARRSRPQVQPSSAMTSEPVEWPQYDSTSQNYMLLGMPAFVHSYVLFPHVSAELATGAEARAVV